MPSYYTYLITTLPALHFLGKAPFSVEEFLIICSHFIPDKEIELLRNANKPEGFVYHGKAKNTLKAWQDFETTLRNELVKIRSARKHIDPHKYMRQEIFIDSYVPQLAMRAYRSTSILDSQKLIDQARWDKLDELSLGHFFDLEFLLIYLFKLSILCRWEKISKADKAGLLEKALGRGLKN